MTAGKFHPPHVGHLHLVAQATRQVDRLVVLVCDHPQQVLPAKDRAAWLRDVAPDGVTVIVTPDDLAADDSRAWARRAEAVVAGLGLGRIDVAFTSEAYGDTWAADLGATHVAIDPERRAVPVSATAVRADLEGEFHQLVPSARSALARRIVLVGAESTGKSTLAEQLARELGTAWVPEWARAYDAGRRTAPDTSWTPDEFRLIVREQSRLEDQLARRARRGVVVCDTDALATAVWRQRYLGGADPWIERAAVQRRPSLYLLCAPDLPWVDDGTRESREHRRSMHAGFLERLGAADVPFAEIVGVGEARLDAALAAVERLLPPLPQLDRSLETS